MDITGDLLSSLTLLRHLAGNQSRYLVDLDDGLSDGADGGDGSAGFSSCEIFRRDAGGGMEAMAGTGASSANGWRAAGFDSSSRTNSLMYSDESSPQFWQTKRMGFRAISGVTSKLYFVPQEHWIFIYGFGFNSTTPGVAGSENVSCAGLSCTLPSHKRKLPPYL